MVPVVRPAEAFSFAEAARYLYLRIPSLKVQSMKWGDIGLRSIRSGCRPIQDATYQREGKGEAAMIGHQ